MRPVPARTPIALSVALALLLPLGLSACAIESGGPGLSPADPGDGEATSEPSGLAGRTLVSTGVTGHELIAPAMHLRSLARHDFDSVLLPYNYLLHRNEAYRRAFDTVRQVCRERNVAVQIIKSLAAGPWDDKPKTHTTWYEPLADQESIDRAVWFVLGQEDVFLNTVGDVELLPKVLDAASRFERCPSDEEMQEMVQRRAMTPLFV